MLKLILPEEKQMKKVMCEYGGIEDSPALLEDKEEKRVWIKTKP